MKPDLVFLCSWVIAILASDDNDQKEKELLELCEAVGVEPIIHHRALIGDDVLLFDKTMNHVCKKLSSDIRAIIND